MYTAAQLKRLTSRSIHWQITDDGMNYVVLDGHVGIKAAKLPDALRAIMYGCFERAPEPSNDTKLRWAAGWAAPTTEKGQLYPLFTDTSAQAVQPAHVLERVLGAKDHIAYMTELAVLDDGSVLRFDVKALPPDWYRMPLRALRRGLVIDYTQYPHPELQVLVMCLNLGDDAPWPKLHRHIAQKEA